ncbi:MAG: phosphate ABC transporter permease subunit PstC [Actinomycetes bacterium]|jgi:phosphate transport system permease protein|nr:phosphate ABC transporter permease subunit PstC [Actinomycetes bacterium]
MSDTMSERVQTSSSADGVASVAAPKTGHLQLVSRSTQLKEAALATLFFLCALVAVLAVFLIFAFVAWKAAPLFSEIGFLDFISGTQWSVADNVYGIVPFLVGSLVVTAGALVIGAPLAVMTSVFLSEIAAPRVRAIIRPAVELLAGIPSVVYGFFGVVVVAPIIARFFGGAGFGPLTGWIILSIMIVPTIATLSEDALNSIPMGIREASSAMGATQWQTIYKVVLPAAKVGIIDAVILGMGRAIGETMAVLMVVGNAPQMFAGITAPISTLTSQIVLGMSYSSGLHRTALFGMAAILFLISMALVLTVRLMSRDERRKRKKRERRA